MLMRRIALVVAGLALVGLSPEGAAGVRGSVAPKAVLHAGTALDGRSQPGRVIHSTWEGEDFDRSKPPVRWPKALEAAPDDTVAVEIPTQDPPFWIQVSAWKDLRPNGIPRGRRELSECGPPTTSGLANTCSLRPTVTSSGVAWRIEFDLERTTGPYYIAVFAAWDDAEVAWLNHLTLRN